MKTFILLLAFPFLCTLTYAQNVKEAEKLVREGVHYHDQGAYNKAIAKYDSALVLDKNNKFALTEKAFSLLALQQYDAAIDYCQKVLTTNSGNQVPQTVYVVYGNALDGMKQADQAIAIYDQGLEQYPANYELYFNKGITLVGLKKYDAAIGCFQKSASLQPQHASSHNAIAQLSDMDNKRVPALLAYCRFLAVEPEGDRARQNLGYLQEIMKGNTTKTGDKSVTVNLSSAVVDGASATGHPKENDFSVTDLTLSLDAALDYDKKNKKKTEVEQFIRKLSTVCSSLEETREGNQGFFWDYYVPYFVEMKAKDLVEPFAYVAFSSSDDADVAKWLKSHKAEVDRFFNWSDAFVWKTE